MKVLTLDKHRQPLTWVDWKTAVLYEAKDMVTWSDGEIVFTAHGGKNRFTGEQTVIRVPSIVAVDNEEYIKYRQPVLTNKALFRRDLYTCAYCTRVLDESKLTRDHVKPVSRGGKNTWNNCVTACKKCNNLKDDQLLEEMRGMVLAYVPYTPDRNEMLILRNRNIRADQMALIVKYLPEHSRARNLLIE